METKTQKEKGSDESDPFSLRLAERTGLEPATPGVTGRYSNQLNYRSIYYSIVLAHDRLMRKEEGPDASDPLL